MIDARLQRGRLVAEVVRLPGPKSYDFGYKRVRLRGPKSYDFGYKRVRLQGPKSHDFGSKRVGAVMLVAVWLAAAAAWADPGGSALRVDQRATIRIDRQRIAIEYAATLNRPGAFQEFLTIDADGDGQLSMTEQETYFDRVRRRIMAGLEITAGGRELPLRQAGEMVLVMPFTKIFHFETDQPVGWEGGVAFEFHNDNYLAHDGDVAIRVEGAEGVQLDFCSLQQPGRDAATAAGIVVPPPSFAPRQQRDVVVRYASGAEPDARPAAAAAVAPAPEDEHRSDFSVVSFETGLLGAGIAALVWLAVSMVLARHRGGRGRPRRAALAGAACLVVLGTAWSVRGAIANTSDVVAPISDEAAVTIFRGLHQDIYSAFQAETENDLYDALAASLDGDLLGRTYLQIRRLTMRDDRSNGFRVRRVKPLGSEVLPDGTATPSSFRVRHRWRVYGVVSHSGHRHGRVNEYEATFSVDRKDGDWRITQVEICDYHRAEPGLLFASTAP